MAEAITALRAPLRRAGPLADHQEVSFGLLPPMTRLSVRGGPEAAARFGRAFGVALPTEPLRAAAKGDKAALWLGPDEWLLLAPEDPGLFRQVETGLEGEPGAVVDISHRQAALEIVGAGAAPVLNTGCPLDLDLSAFPVGMSTRTILNKAEIVLWRRAPDRFHLECWRSFTAYVADFLRQAVDDSGF